MSNITGDRLQMAIQCNEKYKLPEFNDIIKCADGLLGSNIKYAYGMRTHTLLPSLLYVPWITIDNVYSIEMRSAAQKDIVQAIRVLLAVRLFRDNILI